MPDESFLEHLEDDLHKVESEVETFAHGAEHDVTDVAPVLEDAADVADVVDPAISPEVTVADDVVKDIDAEAEKLEVVEAPVTVVPPTDLESGVTPVDELSATPAPAPAATETEPATSPSEAPVVVPAPTQVLPKDPVFHDTRERDAAVNAGMVPGLTQEATKALENLTIAVKAVEDWIAYAKDAIEKVKKIG